MEEIMKDKILRKIDKLLNTNFPTPVFKTSKYRMFFNMNSVKTIMLSIEDISILQEIKNNSIRYALYLKSINVSLDHKDLEYIFNKLNDSYEIIMKKHKENKYKELEDYLND